jgi:hypothetical protein
VHDQLPPPLLKNIISLRYAGSLAIVANAHAWLQELYFWQTSRCLPPQCRDLCQISCTRFSPVRYRQISSAIAGTALYSRFAGHSGGAQLRGRGGRVRPSPGQPRRFSRATIKRSLRVGTCVRYNYYVQLVAIWRARVPKRNNIFPEGGWKLVVHITVVIF